MVHSSFIDQEIWFVIFNGILLSNPVAEIT